MSHTIGQSEQSTQESNSNSNQSSSDSLSLEVSSSAPMSGLSDTDYEFLFNQLLEGVAHGWQDRRIIKFFNQLGDRGQQAEWVAWLNRLRGKLFKLPIESKQQVGTMMIRFGELTQSAVEVKHIGAAAHSLGRELLFGDNVTTIWEYVGPDASLAIEQLETEELSQRLPSNFADLGNKQSEELDSVTIEPSTAGNVNREPEPNIKENDISTKAENPSEETESLSDREAAFTDTLISADELWANDSFVADRPEQTKSVEEIEPDLNLDLDSSDRVTSYDEEFEFEPEVEPLAEAPQPEAQTQQVAADLQPELPISAPNDLSDILQAFGLDADSNLVAENSVTNLDRENKKQSVTASRPNSLALNRQSQETIDPNMSTLDDSSLELIESWFNLGLKQVSAGEYSKAIASWDKALGINANLPEAWHNRGSALGRLGDYEAAIKSFQNALEIDPENYQAWNDRAHALYQLQDWSGAVESWTKAIEIMPGNHLFWYNRGCSLEQLSQWSEAIASYEKALEIKPDFQPGRSRYINLVADNSRPN